MLSSKSALCGIPVDRGGLAALVEVCDKIARAARGRRDI